MLGKQQDVSDHLNRSVRTRRITLIGEALIVGTAAGGVAMFYRFAMEMSVSLHTFFLDHASSVPLIILYFALLLLMAAGVAKLIQFEPYIAGSGIPQTMAEIRGYIDMPWLRVILAKLSGSLLCIIGGLSLGREGPSVQLGGMAGKGCSKILKRDDVEERYLVTCGASAGISAAFNCPITGVMFALETFHRDYSPIMLFTAMAASVVADFLSKSAFGMSPVFRVPLMESLPISAVGLVVLVGIITGLTGALFNKAMEGTGYLYKKMSAVPKNWHPTICFVMAGILGFFLPQVLGDGHIMLNELSSGSLTFEMICLLFVVKFLFSMMCFNSQAPGGSLAPMMVLGAFVGGIFGSGLVKFFGMDEVLVNNFVILAMAGYFAAIVRAPLTAIVLACELTGSLNNFVYVAGVVLIAEFIAYLIGTKPLYEASFRGIVKASVKKENGENKAPEKSENTLIGADVTSGSALDGALVNDIEWPEDVLVISINRDGNDIIPHGDILLKAGDHLTFICTKDEYTTVHERISRLAGFDAAGPFTEDLGKVNKTKDESGN